MNNTCHICLEDIEYIQEEIVKICCDAFICNPCWLSLTDNPDISHCPICRDTISSNRNTYENRVRPCYDNYRIVINRFLIFILSALIGMSIVTLVLFIAYYNNKELFFKDLKFVSTRLHFWIAITCIGYMIFSCIKYCFVNC